MTGRFKNTFGARKVCIGVVHLSPLPGSPGFRGHLSSVIDRAVNEAEVIEKAGFDGLIIENYGDLPFFAERVGPETVAAMAIAVREVRRSIGIAAGVNVLRNDYESALAIAAACECEFIRVNVLVGAYVSPEGMIEGNPARVLRVRQRLGRDIMIFADAMVKHAYPLSATTIGDDALDAAERGMADCVIVTGARTGDPPAREDLEVVRARLDQAGVEIPVLVGSGVTPSNAKDLLGLGDGLIIGSYIRKHGKAGQEIEFERAAEIVNIKKEVAGQKWH